MPEFCVECIESTVFQGDFKYILKGFEINVS